MENTPEPKKDVSSTVPELLKSSGEIKTVANGCAAESEAGQDPERILSSILATESSIEDECSFRTALTSIQNDLSFTYPEDMPSTAPVDAGNDLPKGCASNLSIRVASVSVIDVEEIQSVEERDKCEKATECQQDNLNIKSETPISQPAKGAERTESSKPKEISLHSVFTKLSAVDVSLMSDGSQATFMDWWFAPAPKSDWCDQNRSSAPEQDLKDSVARPGLAQISSQTVEKEEVSSCSSPTSENSITRMERQIIPERVNDMVSSQDSSSAFFGFQFQFEADLNDSKELIGSQKPSESILNDCGKNAEPLNDLEHVASLMCTVEKQKEKKNALLTTHSKRFCKNRTKKEGKHKKKRSCAGMTSKCKKHRDQNQNDKHLLQVFKTNAKENSVGSESEEVGLQVCDLTTQNDADLDKKSSRIHAGCSSNGSEEHILTYLPTIKTIQNLINITDENIPEMKSAISSYGKDGAKDVKENRVIFLLDQNLNPQVEESCSNTQTFLSRISGQEIKLNTIQLIQRGTENEHSKNDCIESFFSSNYDCKNSLSNAVLENGTEVTTTASHSLDSDVVREKVYLELVHLMDSVKITSPNIHKISSNSNPSNLRLDEKNFSNIHEYTTKNNVSKECAQLFVDSGTKSAGKALKNESLTSDSTNDETIDVKVDPSGASKVIPDDTVCKDDADTAEICDEENKRKMSKMLDLQRENKDEISYDKSLEIEGNSVTLKLEASKITYSPVENTNETLNEISREIGRKSMELKDIKSKQSTSKIGTNEEVVFKTIQEIQEQPKKLDLIRSKDSNLRIKSENNASSNKSRENNEETQTELKVIGSKKVGSLSENKNEKSFIPLPEEEKKLIKLSHLESKDLNFGEESKNVVGGEKNQIMSMTIETTNANLSKENKNKTSETLFLRKKDSLIEPNIKDNYQISSPIKNSVTSNNHDIGSDSNLKSTQSNSLMVRECINLGKDFFVLTDFNQSNGNNPSKEKKDLSKNSVTINRVKEADSSKKILNENKNLINGGGFDKKEENTLNMIVLSKDKINNSNDTNNMSRVEFGESEVRKKFSGKCSVLNIALMLNETSKEDEVNTKNNDTDTKCKPQHVIEKFLDNITYERTVDVNLLSSRQNISDIKNEFILPDQKREVGLQSVTSLKNTQQSVTPNDGFFSQTQIEIDDDNKLKDSRKSSSFFVKRMNSAKDTTKMNKIELTESKLQNNFSPPMVIQSESQNLDKTRNDTAEVKSKTMDRNFTMITTGRDFESIEDHIDGKEQSRERISFNNESCRVKELCFQNEEKIFLLNGFKTPGHMPESNKQLIDSKYVNSFNENIIKSCDLENEQYNELVENNFHIDFSKEYSVNSHESNSTFQNSIKKENEEQPIEFDSKKDKILSDCDYDTFSKEQSQEILFDKKEIMQTWREIDERSKAESIPKLEKLAEKYEHSQSRGISINSQSEAKILPEAAEEESNAKKSFPSESKKTPTLTKVDNTKKEKSKEINSNQKDAYLKKNFKNLTQTLSYTSETLNEYELSRADLSIDSSTCPIQNFDASQQYGKKTARTWVSSLKSYTSKQSEKPVVRLKKSAEPFEICFNTENRETFDITDGLETECGINENILRLPSVTALSGLEDYLGLTENDTRVQTTFSSRTDTDSVEKYLNRGSPQRVYYSSTPEEPLFLTQLHSKNNLNSRSSPSSKPSRVYRKQNENEYCDTLSKHNLLSNDSPSSAKILHAILTNKTSNCKKSSPLNESEEGNKTAIVKDLNQRPTSSSFSGERDGSTLNLKNKPFSKPMPIAESCSITMTIETHAPSSKKKNSNELQIKELGHRSQKESFTAFHKVDQITLKSSFPDSVDKAIPNLDENSIPTDPMSNQNLDKLKKLEDQSTIVKGGQENSKTSEYNLRDDIRANFESEEGNNNSDQYHHSHHQEHTISEGCRKEDSATLDSQRRHVNLQTSDKEDNEFLILCQYYSLVKDNDRLNIAPNSEFKNEAEVSNLSVNSKEFHEPLEAQVRVRLSPEITSLLSHQNLPAASLMASVETLTITSQATLPQWSRVNLIATCQEFCRICHETDRVDDFISPCRCRGSLSLVHRYCLEKWLAESDTNGCELCGQKYQVLRIPRYTLLNSIFRWFSSRENVRDVGDLFFDMIALCAFTPMIVGGSYFGLLVAETVYQRMVSSTISRAASFTLVSMMTTMDLAFLSWFALRTQHHTMQWYGWWRRNCDVQIILPNKKSEKNHKKQP